MSPADGGADAGPASGRRRWWTLAVIAIAQLMVVLDGTVVTIALPSAQRDLGISDANRQWAITAAFLAVLILVGAGGGAGRPPFPAARSTSDNATTRPRESA